MVSDPVPGIKILIVGTVPAVINVPFPKPFFNFLSLHTQKGPDNISAHRTDPAHSRKSRAPEKMEKHGLRPVIAVVGHRYPASYSRALSFQRFPQGPVSDFPPGLLRRHAAGSRIPRDIRLCQIKGQSFILAEPSDIVRIPSCLLPDSVIHMNHCQTEGDYFLQMKHHKKEADGICSPGNSCGYGITLLDHTILFYIFEYFCYHTFTIVQKPGKRNPQSSSFFQIPITSTVMSSRICPLH